MTDEGIGRLKGRCDIPGIDYNSNLVIIEDLVTGGLAGQGWAAARRWFGGSKTTTTEPSGPSSNRAESETRQDPSEQLMPASNNYRPFALIGSLVLLTIVVYIPSVFCGYIWDDDAYVVNNDTLRSLTGLGQLWFNFGATPDYYPLTFTTFWFEYQAWELEPFGYHLDNVLLHAVNVALVFWLLTRLRVPGAFFAAALFAVHPVHVESVTWITERKNVLSGLCFLLSVGAFAHAYGLDEKGPATSIRWRFYALSVGLYLLAMLSKTVTLTLPLILPVLIWWKAGRLRRRDVLLMLPYVAVAVPVILLGFVGDANFGGAGVGVLDQSTEVARLDAQGEGGRWDYTLVERLLITGRAMWFYAAKLLWPLNLAFVYPRWTIDSSAWWQYVIALSAAAVPITLWCLRGRWGRGPVAAVLFYGLMLAPGSGMFNYYFQRYSFVADHLQYLASLGIIALIAGAISQFARRGRAKSELAWSGALLAVLTILGMLTTSQQFAYRDARTLWVSTLATNPAAILARVNLASILLEEGDVRQAVQLLDEGLHYAVQENEVVGLYTHLGEIHAALGQQEAAIRYFESALEVDSQSIWARVGLATLLARRKDTGAALEHYRRALDVLPGDSQDARLLRAAIDDLRRSAADKDLGSDKESPLAEDALAPPN